MHTQWKQQPQQQNMETEQMAAVQAERDRQRDNLTGVWVAFEFGGHGESAQSRPFKTEIEALRHAMQAGGALQVKFVEYGSDVFA